MATVSAAEGVSYLNCLLQGRSSPGSAGSC